MHYLTVEKLRVALNPNDTDPARTAASLPGTWLERCITDAETEIDARLGTRYTVPFDPVPDLVVRLVTDFAVYTATLYWRETVDLEERDPVQLRYQAAKTLLNDVVSGKAEVPGVSEPESEAGVGDPQNVHSVPLFEAGDFDLFLAPKRYHDGTLLRYETEGVWH